MNNKDAITIDLVELFSVLWKKLLLIIFAGLLAAGAAFGYTVMFISPKYEANACFFVNNSSYSFDSANYSVSSSELSASNSLVSNYILILESRTTLEEVIRRADLSYNYEELSKMVDAEALTGTASFQVTVSSTDPTEAEIIANTIIEVLPGRISEIVDGSSVRVIDYAIIPDHRSSPSYIKNTLIGFIAGAVLTICAVAVVYLLKVQNDDVIHSASDLKEKYPDIIIMGKIPDFSLPEKDGYYYSSYYYGNRKGKRK